MNEYTIEGAVLGDVIYTGAGVMSGDYAVAGCYIIWTYSGNETAQLDTSLVKAGSIITKHGDTAVLGIINKYNEDPYGGSTLFWEVTTKDNLSLIELLGGDDVAMQDGVDIYTNAQAFGGSIAEKLTVIAENEQKVFNAGKKSEYDRFWDDYQQNGNRTDYTNGFGGCWSAETFKPKYSMRPTTAYMMLRYLRANVDLVEHLKSLGVTLDFSNCTNFQYTFYGSQFTRVGVIDISKATQSNVQATFGSCGYLETVDRLIVNENQVINFFSSASSLVNIEIEGVIGQNVDIHHSPLSVDSMISIISCLKDYSAVGGTHTVTFKKDRETLLTAAEKAEATEKGWTLAWS